MTTPTIGTRARPRVVHATTTPSIGDLVPGVVIYRYANIRPGRIVSYVPCGHDEVVSIPYKETSSPVVDQTVVCRHCRTVYAATPVPPTEETARHRIVYRPTGGSVVMSRTKIPGDGVL
jgi:hypothetical protein